MKAGLIFLYRNPETGIPAALCQSEPLDVFCRVECTHDPLEAILEYLRLHYEGGVGFYYMQHQSEIVLLQRLQQQDVYALFVEDPDYAQHLLNEAHSSTRPMCSVTEDSLPSMRDLTMKEILAEGFQICQPCYQ